MIKKGFHHGNLTPSNILCHNGLMKLSDYGLQISSLNDDVSNQIKNTVYLAPEVLEGKKYSDKSDIWSLGFIFYEVNHIQTIDALRNCPLENWWICQDLHRKT